MRFLRLASDLRQGARALARQPGFFALATILLAVGIGAATTLASVGYTVLVKPLAWPGAARLALLTETRQGATRALPNILTNATYLAWRDAPETLDALAAYTSSTVTVTSGGGAERVRIVAATASLFSVLDARPLVGQVFTPADQGPGHDRAVVLSFAFWQRRLGADAAIVGQTVEFDGDRYRVVAVMPREFAFPNRTTVAWVPLDVPPVLGADPGMRSVSLFRAVGRLKSGVTFAQASAEGTARGRSAPSLGLVGTAVFGTAGPPRVTAAPYLESITADVRPAIDILLTGVALLLGVAMTNVAGLQLTRATARRRDMALRAALGAGPGRLAGHLLAENLVLGLAGGAAGWLLSLGLHPLLVHVLPPDFPRVDELATDWRLWAGAMAAALLATATAGTLPAIVARRINIVETLTEDSLAPVGAGLGSTLGRLRAAIMAGQVALAAMLLVGAALVGQSFLALVRADRGYDPHNLLTATLPMPAGEFSGAARAALLDAILERLAHTPGVTAAAAASVMPLVPYDQPMSFEMPGRSGPMAVQADLRSVSPDYFKALGMPILDGRGFSPADARTSAPVVVVNRAFARAYLTGPAVGTRLPVAFESGRPEGVEIVGVVADVRQQSAATPARPEIFNSYRQLESGMTVPSPVIVARAAGNPVDLVVPLRAIIRGERSTLALDSVMTMDDRLLTSLARPRLYAILLGGFAAFAVLVAGTGLFGALSYSVAQRTRELGVRAALGATPFQIVSLVVGQGVTIALSGLVVGLGVAGLGVTYLGTLLYGVTPHDPLTFTIVPIALVLVAALAALAPARRAARIDPLRAIRHS